MKEFETITLHDENGVEQAFTLLRTLCLDGEYYLFLQPEEAEEAAEEDDLYVTILHLNPENPREVSYDLVTDEALIERLIECYQQEDTPSTVLDDLIEDEPEETDDDHA